MKFYVIYSFDCPKSESVKAFQPPQLDKWEMTEGDDQYEYGYLEGDWTKGKHRKYTRMIESKKDFHLFIDETGLIADSVETMGSLTEFGLLPAISFNSEYSDYQGFANAYVTPIAQNHEGKDLEGKEKHWNWIKQALLNLYGAREKFYLKTYENYKNKVRGN